MNTIAIILYSNFFIGLTGLTTDKLVLRKFINFHPPPICLNVY